MNSLSIRHLHLQPKVIAQLEQMGCSAIAEIPALLKVYKFERDVQRPLLGAIVAIASCLRGTDVDWLKFYERPGFKCQGLFFLCKEFEVLDSDDLNFAINRNSFGNAGAILERAGLGNFIGLMKTLGDGIDKAPPGMDASKVCELWDKLIVLAKSAREDPSFLMQFASSFPLQDEAEIIRPTSCEVDEKQQEKAESTLSDISLKLDIGVLHIGAKTNKLREHGIVCVQDLLDISRNEILSWHGMGKSTTSRIQESIEALKRAQLPDGNVDWEIFCSHMQLSLLPAQNLNGSMADTILLLHEVIGETILAVETNDNRLILKERIMRPPSERLTLEAVSELMPVKITRERVRQKEEKILKRLANALMYNDYGQAPYHFRPEFTAPWVKVALHFADIQKDISLFTLIEGLEDAWGVPKDVFSDQLPLIMAIITGELASGNDFKRNLPEQLPLLAYGSGVALELPLRKLQIGKAARNLEEQGVYTVSEFLTAISAGDIDILDNSSTKSTYNHINLLACCVFDNGEINWPQYAQDSDVPDYPLHLVQTPEQFLSALLPTAIGVLKSRQLSARAPEIFEMRTSVGLASRPTAEKVADKIGGFASSIKMVETKLLNFLSEVFIDGYVCLARANVDEEFLSYWTDIDQTFEKFDGDSELLQRELCEKWAVSNEMLTQYMPAIIAILTGYPMGRLTRHNITAGTAQQTRKENVKAIDYARTSEPDFTPKMVSLRGFRRAH